MSLYDEIDRALAPLERVGSIVLKRPKSRTVASFRSTIYNALRTRGLSAKVKAVGDGDYEVILCQPEEIKSGLSNTGRIDFRTPKLTTEIVAAATVFMENYMIQSIEFVGATEAELLAVCMHEGTQVVSLEGHIITDTGYGIRLSTHAPALTIKNILEDL
jgi:hypothetical protein